METLSHSFETYKNEVIVLKGQSIRTEEGFLVSKRVIVNFFGDVPTTSLTVDDVRKFHVSLRNRNLSINTMRGYLFSLKSVIRYCKLRGLDVMDSDLIIIPKREQTVPDYLTPKEVDLVLKSIRIRRGSNKLSVLRDKAMVSMIYGSGLRASELCSLDRRGWDTQKATIIGKGGKPRVVFWDRRTHLLLKDYIKARKDTCSALFVSTSGDRLKRACVVKIFIRLQKLTGVKELHAHTLRHSYATNLMENGMHIYTLSRLMGHSSIQTTSQYLHTSDPKMQEEYHRYHTV